MHSSDHHIINFKSSNTMDYILFFTAILAILAMFFSIKLIKNNSVQGVFKKNTRNLPPVVTAWPLVGSLFTLIKDPENLIKSGYQKHGSVFTVKVLGMSITMLIGPEVSRYFYTATDSELSQEELYYKITTPLFGPDVAFGENVSEEVRQQQFQFLKIGLRPQMLRHYVGQTFIEVQDYFSRWKDCGTVDLSKELQRLVPLVTTRCLLGNDVRGKLSEDVSSLMRELGNGLLPISFLFPYLPIPAHNRRDRARKKIHQIFSNIIKSRTNSFQSEEDLLQILLDSRYKDGKRNTDEQVIGLSIALLFSGQHNTGTAVVVAGQYLFENKTYFARVIEEQKALIRRHGSELDFNVLGEMDVLHRCIREAMRIGSLPILTPRYCRKTFTVTTNNGEKYTVPRGHIVATSPATANSIGYIHNNPDTFNPDRYLFDNKKKERASQLFSDTFFGGGRHRCPGETFTYVMLKTVWSFIIRNFEIDLVSPLPAGKWNGKDKILVHYKRRQLSL